MGMRRNIALTYTGQKEPSIYLYTHWGADGLEEVLAQSLNRARERWSDEAYLARVIFTDMTAGAGSDVTGYGLAPYECDPEYKTLKVNLAEMTVNGVRFDDFIDDPSQFAI